MSAELLPFEDWVLMDTSGGLAAPRFSVTLRFEAGRVSGKGPVNRYFANAAIVGSTLGLQQIGSTRMAGPQDAMDAETAYFEALSTVTGWEAFGDVIRLSGVSNLDFAAPDSPGAFAVTLLGRRRDQAQAAALEAEYQYREIFVDGVPQAVETDEQTDRINATIENGLVARVSVG